MSLATILISIFLVILFVLAIRHLVKNGTCAGCSEKSSCHSSSSGNAGSNCGSCSHCQAESVKIRH
jgi:hypothetical protein